MPRPPVLVGLLVVALVTSGCRSAAVTVTPRPTSSLIAEYVIPTEPTLAPTIDATTSPPSPTASPKPQPPPYDVKAVQRRLTELHYYVGAIDGQRGSSLRSAVMAFQKVQGIGADGGVGTKTLAALKTPKIPALRGTGSGRRVEIDLTKQVLYVITDNAIVRILPVSSGSGKHYLTKKGNVATALSPVGYYAVQRRIVGERKADLGTLYDPEYFYKGWAIHGSNSVPAYPASHGCIRVTRTDAKYLLREIAVGTPVYVYGGKFTFTAGSSAPGTDDPGGDTPEPTPTPILSPSASATATPTPAVTPTAVPTILPSP